MTDIKMHEFMQASIDDFVCRLQVTLVELNKFTKDLENKRLAAFEILNVDKNLN